MQVRAGYSPRRSDQSDLLPPRDRVAHCHERFTEMEISGDDSTTVIDVDDIASQKEIVDERNDTAVGGAHWVSDRPSEIDAKVAAGHAAVEETAGSELACDH
jgi:hypothetical protein